METLKPSFQLLTSSETTSQPVKFVEADQPLHFQAKESIEALKGLKLRNKGHLYQLEYVGLVTKDSIQVCFKKDTYWGADAHVPADQKYSAESLAEILSSELVTDE